MIAVDTVQPVTGLTTEILFFMFGVAIGMTIILCFFWAMMPEYRQWQKELGEKTDEETH